MRIRWAERVARVHTEYSENFDERGKLGDLGIDVRIMLNK